MAHGPAYVVRGQRRQPDRPGWEFPIRGGPAAPLPGVRGLLVTAFAVACAIALAACGGDEDDVAAAVCTTETVSLLDGSVTGLFSDREFETFGATYSPDGSRIAFMRREGDGPREIAIANADGSDVRVVTSRGKTSYLPRWSPDGNNLVFLSQEGEDTLTAELYVVGVDGSGERRLTNDPSWDYIGDWAAGSSSILLGSEREGRWHIMTIAPDGSRQAYLPVDAEGNAGSWAPGGQRIVFASYRDGNDEIYLMDADGGNQRNLTNSPAQDDNPRWSPDGREIAFASDRSGLGQVWVMQADGSVARQLTHNDSVAALLPDWSPSGDRIIYSACPPVG